MKLFKKLGLMLVMLVMVAQAQQSVGDLADSERCRSAFRTDVDHDSEVMPITVPN